MRRIRNLVRFRRIILGLLLAYTSAPGAALATCEIYFAHDCKFTKRSALPVSEEMFRIRENEKGDIDLSGVKAFLATAEKTKPQLDFSSCLMRLSAGLTHVRAISPDNLDSCHKVEFELVEAINRVRPQLRGLVAAYAREAYLRGAAPYREPLGESDPPLENVGRGNRSIPGIQETLRRCDPPLPPAALDAVIVRDIRATTRELSRECRSKLATGFASLLYDAQMTHEQCELQPKQCKERRRQVLAAVALLDRAGLAPFLHPYDRFGIAFKCDVDDWRSFNANLEKQMELVKGAVACHELKVGEMAAIDGDMGTLQHSRYLLQRTGAKSFRAAINLEFVQPGSNPPSPVDEKVATNLRKTVNECFAKVNGGFIHADGMSLDLAVFAPSKNADRKGAAPEPPRQQITVDESIRRVNSVTWRSDLSCHTILHEIFHLLGLPDEYVETGHGNVMQSDGSIVELTTGAGKDRSFYDCRAIGPRHSVMRDPTYALRVFESKRSAISPGKRSEPPPSLLLPAQFRSIVFPGCDDSNQVYYACSKDAYVTSIDRYGGRRCMLGKPASCASKEGDDEWLR